MGIGQRTKKQEPQRFLSQASNVLSSSLDYETTLTTVAKLVVPYLADVCIVYMKQNNSSIRRIALESIDPQVTKVTQEMKRRFMLNPKAHQGVPNVIRTGKAVLYPIASAKILSSDVHNKKELEKLLSTIPIKSWMCAPLSARGRTFGAISFISAKSKRHYTQSDLLQGVELGRAAGMAIDNARLYRKAQEEIRERKRAEDELRTSRDQLEVIFQSVDDGITVQDATGTLLFANDAAAKLTGFSSVEELMNTTPSEIVQKFELFDEFGNPLALSDLPGRRALKGEEHVPEMLVRYRFKETGQEKWSMLKATPVFDEANRIQFAINVFQDVTQRKLMEKHKDEFFAIASHELKTPITSIRAFAQIMKKCIIGKGDKESLYYISKMETQLSKLTNLIGDLLDISKIQAGKLLFNEEVFAIDTLIRETVEDLQQTTEICEIILEGETKKRVYGDRDRISQVLTNLITNAIKYSPGCKKIVVGLLTNSQVVTISVQDFGIGIGRHDQKRIFERFFQAFIPKRETYPGLGVGLYISAEIIKRHKGHIWVESKKGKGSTFFFSLPMYTGKQVLENKEFLQQKELTYA